MADKGSSYGDYQVTPVPPNSLRITVKGCIDGYGVIKDIDITVNSYGACVLTEKLARGLRTLAEINKQIADEQAVV